MDNLIYGKVIPEELKKEYKLGKYRWKDSFTYLIILYSDHNQVFNNYINTICSNN